MTCAKNHEFVGSTQKRDVTLTVLAVPRDSRCRFGRRAAVLTSLAVLTAARVGGGVAPWFPLFVACGVVAQATGLGFFTQGYLLGTFSVVGTHV